MSRPRRLNVFKPAPRTRHIGAEHELTIERLGDEGQGIGHWKGKRVFVDAALPGETVWVKISAENRHGLFGSIQSFCGELSAHRVDAPCRYYGQCGGCQLQHLAYPEQLAHKQHVARRRLHRVIADPNWLEPVAAAPWYYRHRTRLQVEVCGEVVQLGFRRQGSHRFIDIEECLQWQEPLGRAVAALRQLLPEVNHAKRIEEIQLACGEGARTAVSFRVKSGFAAADIESLAAACDDKSWLIEIVDSSNNRLVWSNELPPLTYPGHQQLWFGAGDFSQANPTINSAMIADVVTWLAPGTEDTVAEFFAGLGNFSLPLARTGCTVKAHELGEAMVTRAREAASASGCARLSFTATDLFDSSQLKALRSDMAECTQVLLDPPRAGARQLCQQLAEWVEAGEAAASRIVYVSCNSLALAGDLEPLIAAGFRVERARIYDMFPHTSHFETMVLLVRD